MNISQGSFTPKSFHKKRRTAIFFAVLVALLSTLFLCSLAIGAVRIDLASALSALAGGDLSNPDLRILAFVRAPRVVGAILAGAALAMSGTIIQAVLCNPMAAPNVIGVNAGAGFAVVLLIALAPAAVAFLPLAAFIGALGACMLVYAIALKTKASRITVTLVGLAVASILSAASNALKMLFPDMLYDVDSFMIGGLSGVSFTELAPAAALIIAASALVFIFPRGLDVLSLGSDSAASLGMRVPLARFLYLALAGALAGAAVSFAGLIGFVGLLVPHIARRFVGSSHKYLLPASALGGAFLVLLCDLFARSAFSPYELQVGIILSLVGGPFFIFLVLFSGREYRD